MTSHCSCLEHCFLFQGQARTLTSKISAASGRVRSETFFFRELSVAQNPEGNLNPPDPAPGREAWFTDNGLKIGFTPSWLGAQLQPFPKIDTFCHLSKPLPGPAGERVSCRSRMSKLFSCSFHFAALTSMVLTLRKDPINFECLQIGWPNVSRGVKKSASFPQSENTGQ